MKTFSRGCFFCSLCVFVLLVQAQDQSGFISLDCGLPANSSSYTEEKTTISFISDAPYIRTGESRTISPKYKAIFLKPLWYLRSFPQGIRNCYNISVVRSTRYLIRAAFLYGNYDGLNKLPIFHVYLEDSLWHTVNITNNIFFKELIHVPSANEVHICLVNTGHGIPFISSLEFRPLPEDTYPTESVSLSLFVRFDFGSTTNQTCRFPCDVYDRPWFAYNDAEQFTQISTSQTIGTSEFNNDYYPASFVMGTAVTAKNASKPLELPWDSPDKTIQYYVYLHFAEVVELRSNQTRGFNITHNGKLFYGPLIPKYLTTTTIYSTGPLSMSSTRHEILLTKIENSTLPPIINALEIYSAIEIYELRSNKEDEDAIRNFRSTFGAIKDWEGDPCIPRAYPWSGVGCSNEISPRIISLNLSGSALMGEISPAISNLAMLQTLDLSNNHLKGRVPDSLSKLKYLQVLKLENNNLTGPIPPELIKRSNEGSLSLSVEGNPNLGACALGTCTKKEKNNNFVIPVVASVGGLLVIVIIAGIILWIARSKKKQQGKDIVSVVDLSERNTHFGSSLELRRQQFTYSEVTNMTNNFERILGTGGFGKVYHGVVDGIEVAVKMLSPSAIQGYHQFQAEVTILMRVHHRNLTSLVGYLQEGTHLGLIYEYMAHGNLAGHLSEKSSHILSWQDRFRIAMDAAQGLEYLHDGCKPSIVHRDVKTTNILLTEKFQGKLSDFGLSKSYPTDEKTHMSTIIAGTPGYLDPEYYKSNWLTEKSDVYSFGVTLLEIVSCRPVISRTEGQDLAYIVKWVGSMFAQGDIRNIIDPRLKGQYNINSVWKAVEVAMACVSVNSSRRPTMSQVVAELKVCLATELSRMSDGHPSDSIGSIEMTSFLWLCHLNRVPWQGEIIWV